MAVKLGNGNWAVKEDKLLAYNDNSGRFFNKEFDFARGSSATYVGKDGLIKSAASDVPRIDFSDSTNGALLLEGQSTNLVPYSEDYSHSSWVKTDVSIQSGYIAPDGTNSAYKVTKIGSNAHLVNATTGGHTATKSIFAKTTSGTGTIILFNSVDTYFTITEEWQRFDIQHNGLDFFYAADFRGASTLTEIIIWGAQSEALSYPTSYIKSNTGSTVTRLADACNNSGSAQDFNSESGVLYLEVSRFANDILNTAISINQSGNFSNSVSIRFRSAENLIYGLIYSSGNISTLMQYTLSDDTQFNKIALSYAENNFALWVNGIKVLTDTSGNAPIGLNNLSFNLGTEPFYGKTKDIQVFTEALTDEQLAELTTI
jgi:hypothetical protein